MIMYFLDLNLVTLDSSIIMGLSKIDYRKDTRLCVHGNTWSILYSCITWSHCDYASVEVNVEQISTDSPEAIQDSGVLSVGLVSIKRFYPDRRAVEDLCVCVCVCEGVRVCVSVRCEGVCVCEGVCECEV